MWSHVWGFGASVLAGDLGRLPPMQSDEAKDRLRTLLVTAGVDLDAPRQEDVGRTWAVMRVFFAEVVEDAAPREEDGDGLLAQYGIYDFSGQPLYELDMTRQFSFNDEEGEYDHMSQLQCTFEFEPSEELRAVPDANLWSWDAGDFFAEALAMPGFGIVEELKLTPRRLVIDYSEV
jgi:hypothetical protein